MIKVSSTQHPEYNEATALQELLVAINEAQADDNEQFEENDSFDSISQIVITVAGKSIAFLAGGPQASGLHEFVEHIAAENGYIVDFKNLTVQ